MYLYSKSSYPRIMHTEQCPYASRIRKENLVLVHDPIEISPSCQPCFFCSRLGKMYRKEKRDIDAFCQSSKFTCKWKDGYLQIDGPVESWRIVYSIRHKRITIYHQNSSLYKPKSNSTYEHIDGYHHQKWYFRTIISALQSMQEHQWAYLDRDGLPIGMKHHINSLLPKSEPRPGLSKKRKHKEARAAKHFEKRQKAIRVLKILEQWKNET